MESRHTPGLASALEREPAPNVQATNSTHPASASIVSSLASRFESTTTLKTSSSSSISTTATTSSSSANSATVTKVSSIADRFSNENESTPMPASVPLKPPPSATNPSLRSAPSLPATTRSGASARIREVDVPAVSRVASAAAVFSNAGGKGTDSSNGGAFAAAQSTFRNAEINDAAEISKVKAAALKFGRPDGIESSPVIKRHGDAALQQDTSAPVVERKKSVMEVAGVFEGNSMSAKNVSASELSTEEPAARVAEVKSVFDGAAQPRNHVGKSEQGEQKSVRERFEGAARMFGASV